MSASPTHESVSFEWIGPPSEKGKAMCSRTVMENAQLYGMESLGQASDVDLLQLALGSKRVEAKKMLNKIQEIIEENNGIEGLSKNMDALFLVDSRRGIQIGAILEMSKRLVAEAEKKKGRITTASEAAAVVRDMMFLNHEEMHVLCLNKKNELIARVKQYRGTVSGSILRAAEVFRPAVTRNIPNIIICHNHPSGDPSPSPEDIEVTEQLVAAGKLLDIEVLDHLIMGSSRFISLKQHMGSW